MPPVADCGGTAGEVRRREQRPALRGYQRLHRVRENRLHLGLIATQGCHNRCDFCYLATGDTRIKYQMRPPEQVASEFAATGAPYGVFIDNNLGSRPDYLRRLCRALRPLEKIWSAAVSLDVTDDPTVAVNVVLPERLHANLRMLRGRRALAIKRCLLFEPHVILSSVPTRA